MTVQEQLWKETSEANKLAYKVMAKAYDNLEAHYKKLEEQFDRMVEVCREAFLIIKDIEDGLAECNDEYEGTTNTEIKLRARITHLEDQLAAFKEGKHA